MSGAVGNTSIRTDVRQGIIDRTPLEQVPGLIERADRIRAENVVQPFDRARTTEVTNLVEFYELFKKVLETATEMDGTAYPIRFTMEYPPVGAVLPCFSTKLISSRPLKLRGTREMGPRLMAAYEDPDYPGEIIEEHLVRQYNTIEMVVWAKTNKVANEMAEWVLDKFWEYLWALQWGGSSHPVEWLGRGEDKYDEVREQGMFGAPITFGVITGRITKKRVTALRKLAISLGLLIEDRPVAMGGLTP
jgi:hypothetical protein